MVSVHPLKINAIFITISWTNCEKYGYSNFSTTSPRHFSRISPIAKTRQAFQPLLVSGVQHFHNHLGVDGTRSPMKIENMSWSGSPTESWYNKNITRKFRHNQLWLLGEVLWSALQRSIYILVYKFTIVYWGYSNLTKNHTWIIIGSWCGSAGSDPPPLTGFAWQNPQPLGVQTVPYVHPQDGHPSVGDSVRQNQWEEGGLTQQTRISSLWNNWMTGIESSATANPTPPKKMQNDAVVHDTPLPMDPIVPS